MILKGEKMHPVNKILSLFGLRLSKVNRAIPPPIDHREIAFRDKYERIFDQVKNNRRGFEVYKAYRYNIGEHPKNLLDLEFEFTAYYLYKAKPLKVLDIGSYRHFILGLLAHYDVTTVDIRKRRSMLENETVITCDAKALNFPNNSFDSVITLEVLPHTGLGRYGDEIDLDADIKVFNEMIRVLKSGGILIFTTAITGGKPSIAWNARRNYSYEMIRGFCEGLDLVEEKFYDLRALRHCTREELTTDPTFFDYYFGCWRKR